MPAPGDQYRSTPVSANPFEEIIPRINEYTAKEIATLQSRLDRQLGPEYISTRPGQGGGKVHYLAAEKVINLANEVFGFNGWSSQIQNVQIDFVDENATTGKISLGLSTIVRVTLKDGTFHEDIGYGHIENCKGKAAAFEKAKKEATTDALKRSLRNFGNVLGNCLYDKDYLQRITKVKIAPAKWDAENLHRHHDFRPIKREAIADAEVEERPAELVKQQSLVSNNTEYEDEFGGSLFDEVEMPGEHTDQVVIQPRPNEAQPQNRPLPSNAQAISRPPPNRPMQPNTGQPGRPNGQMQQQQQQQPQQQQQRPGNGPNIPPNRGSGPHQMQPPNSRIPPPQGGQQNNRAPPDFHSAENRPQPPQQMQGQNHNHHSTPPSFVHPNPTTTPFNHETPVGFTSGRAAAVLNSQDISAAPETLANLPRFNPKAESPSIRRTNGFDHTRSGKVMRTSLDANPSTGSGVQPPSGPSTTTGPNPIARTGPTNYINPAADVGRRIGMPNGNAASPLANRTAYRPPGPAAAGNKRSYVPQLPEARLPLADVSNTAGGIAQETNRVAGGEDKRMRVGDA